MQMFQWVAYGLDMFGYVVIEIEGMSYAESHEKAVEQFKQSGLDFDTIEPFDKNFIKRLNWLNQ